MNVLAIVCSSKIGGNTEKLAASYLRGAADRGHEVRLLHMGRMNVNPCRGCNACYDSDRCVQQDDMEEIYRAIEACDVLVFATPLYFWGISAQMKIVIDRMYALGQKDEKGYYRYPIKKSVLLCTAADSDRHFWTFELVVQYYYRLVNYFHWTNVGILTAGNCGGTVVGRQIEKTRHLGRAYELGTML